MQTLSVDELMDQGKAVYDSACLACHGAQGEGGDRQCHRRQFVGWETCPSHMAVVAKGVSGTAMQAFGGQLNDC